MKVCSSCKVEKSESDFQIRRESKDGLTFACKACLKIRDKNRDNDSRRQKRREYQKTEAGKQAHKRAMDAYHKRYPMKYASHVITGNAIRDGKLIQASECSVCKSTEKIEGHHDDYTKPLEVRWLCESCHKEWHRHNKPIYE